jgi:hypothetical protein
MAQMLKLAVRRNAPANRCDLKQIMNGGSWKIFHEGSVGWPNEG